MPVVIPSIVQIGFGCTVVFVLFAYLVSFHRADIYRKRFRHLFLVWLALTAILGMRHFFENFHDLPPRLPLFLIVFVIALVIFGRQLARSPSLKSIQQFHLVLFQGFRIPVEILLAMLAQQGLLPVEMSFHGRNVDILVGLSALVLAWWIRRNGEVASRRVLIVWNIAGICILTNVVAHGLLSAPYPFQVLHLSMDNFIIGYFPVIWLPLFLVPTAYFFHGISLYKALRAQTTA